MEMPATLNLIDKIESDINVIEMPKGCDGSHIWIDSIVLWKKYQRYMKVIETKFNGEWYIASGVMKRKLSMRIWTKASEVESCEIPEITYPTEKQLGAVYANWIKNGRPGGIFKFGVTFLYGIPRIMYMLSDTEKATYSMLAHEAVSAVFDDDNERLTNIYELIKRNSKLEKDKLYYEMPRRAKTYWNKTGSNAYIMEEALHEFGMGPEDFGIPSW